MDAPQRYKTFPEFRHTALIFVPLYDDGTLSLSLPPILFLFSALFDITVRTHELCPSFECLGRAVCGWSTAVRVQIHFRPDHEGRRRSLFLRFADRVSLAAFNTIMRLWVLNMTWFFFLHFYWLRVWCVLSVVSFVETCVVRHSMKAVWSNVRCCSSAVN